MVQAPVETTKLRREASTADESALFSGDQADSQRAAMFTTTIPIVQQTDGRDGETAAEFRTATGETSRGRAHEGPAGENADRA